MPESIGDILIVAGITLVVWWVVAIGYTHTIRKDKSPLAWYEIITVLPFWIYVKCLHRDPPPPPPKNPGSDS